MLVLRSLLFNLAFYLNLILWMIILLPCLVLPRQSVMRVVKAWAGSSLWLLRVVAGTRLELRGRGRIPPGGLLVAAKHQSFLETFALVTIFDDPTFVLKRELMWIPLFGWYAWRAGMVPIDRKAGSSALVAMNERARREAARGRQILIFPEGTRRAPGAPPAYKFGVAHLYKNLGSPCVPVALNTGLYWPRRSFLRRPGTAVIEFLEPLPPGLPREVFFEETRSRIEQACQRLLEETAPGSGVVAQPPAALAEPASERRA